MTALHFKNKKISHKGENPTHWTTERMEHCTSISGKFETDPIKEAKNSFKSTFHDSDGYDMEYVDGEKFLEGSFTIPVYGLVFDNGEYYWTGNVLSVKFNLDVSIT